MLTCSPRVSHPLWHSDYLRHVLLVLWSRSAKGPANPHECCWSPCLCQVCQHPTCQSKSHSWAQHEWAGFMPFSSSQWRRSRQREQPFANNLMTSNNLNCFRQVLQFSVNFRDKEVQSDLVEFKASLSYSIYCLYPTLLHWTSAWPSAGAPAKISLFLFLVSLVWSKMD